MCRQFRNHGVCLLWSSLLAAGFGAETTGTTSGISALSSTQLSTTPFFTPADSSTIIQDEEHGHQNGEDFSPASTPEVYSPPVPPPTTFGMALSRRVPPLVPVVPEVSPSLVPVVPNPLESTNDVVVVPAEPHIGADVVPPPEPHIGADALRSLDELGVDETTSVILTSTALHHAPPPPGSGSSTLVESSTEEFTSTSFLPHPSFFGLRLVAEAREGRRLCRHWGRVEQYLHTRFAEVLRRGLDCGPLPGGGATTSSASTPAGPRGPAAAPSSGSASGSAAAAGVGAAAVEPTKKIVRRTPILRERAGSWAEALEEGDEEEQLAQLVALADAEQQDRSEHVFHQGGRVQNAVAAGVVGKIEDAVPRDLPLQEAPLILTRRTEDGDGGAKKGNKAARVKMVAECVRDWADHLLQRVFPYLETMASSIYAEQEQARTRVTQNDYPSSPFGAKASWSSTSRKGGAKGKAPPSASLEESVVAFEKTVRRLQDEVAWKFEQRAAVHRTATDLYLPHLHRVIDIVLAGLDTVISRRDILADL